MPKLNTKEVSLEETIERNKKYNTDEDFVGAKPVGYVSKPVKYMARNKELFDIAMLKYKNAKQKNRELLHILKHIPDKKSISKDLIKEVEEALDMVKSIKIPKKSKSPKHISKAIDISEMIFNTPKIKKGRKNTDNISMAIDLVEMVHKTPKSKKISEKDIESINDSIKEIDKLLKTPKKGLKKLLEADKEHLKYHPSKQDYKEMKMDQKAYKHKVKDVSNLVSNYVAQYKSILSENLSKGVTTRYINKLRNNFYGMAKPSEIDDANSIIRDIKEMLPKPEPKSVKAKVAVSDEDKKFKQVSTYLKNQIKADSFPSLKDEETFKYVCEEAVSKGFKRLSKAFIQSILDE
jgi:hypothetical protein